MKIKDLRATTITVPLEAPLRHAHGAHWGRFVRTIVEVEADNGLVGLGEMGGGGESAEAAFRGLKSLLAGHDPFRLEELRQKICNPCGSLYNGRLQLHAAIEFACLDLIGKQLKVSVSELLGGRLRDTVPFASYLFFRLPDPQSRKGEIRTAEQLVAHARSLRASCGFRTHKLKGGVFPPNHEIACYRALAKAFPDDSLRFDPNAVYSVETAIRVGRAIADLKNDYYEDPTLGIEAMKRVKEALPGLPLSTNMAVLNSDHLAANIRREAIDVILLDTTFWGGIRPCIDAARICSAFGLSVSVHSSGELGIQLATLLHLGAVLPNLTFAADAHYHHLKDDVIKNGKMTYKDGAIAVPKGPGLGVELDREKLEKYAELYRKLGGYPYDRDPARPGWHAKVPDPDYADPKNLDLPAVADTITPHGPS
jgi:glucarate dehydratase